MVRMPANVIFVKGLHDTSKTHRLPRNRHTDLASAFADDISKDQTSTSLFMPFPLLSFCM